jgi:hypothetical protein
VAGTWPTRRARSSFSSRCAGMSERVWLREGRVAERASEQRWAAARGPPTAAGVRVDHPGPPRSVLLQFCACVALRKYARNRDSQLDYSLLSFALSSLGPLHKVSTVGDRRTQVTGWAQCTAPSSPFCASLDRRCDQHLLMCQCCSMRKPLGSS